MKTQLIKQTLWMFFASIQPAFASGPMLKVPVVLPKASVHLQELKDAESTERWTDCRKAFDKAWVKHTTLRGWILVSGLRCARRDASDPHRGKNLKPLIAKATALGDFSSDPFSERLKFELTLARQVVLDEIESTGIRDDQFLTQIQRLDGSENASLRAKALAIYGNDALKSRNFVGARAFFEQALSLRDSKEVRSKLDQVLVALDAQTPSSVTGALSQAGVTTEEEAKLSSRFDSFAQKGDLIGLVDEGINFLHRFPGSRRAKAIQDQVFESYLQIADRLNRLDADHSEYEKWSTLKKRALSSLLKADSPRMMEWARALHRRGDAMGSLALAEKVLTETQWGAQGAALRFIAGRSAQFLGDYRKAIEHFQVYLDLYSGGEDVPEVMLRLGLSWLRLGQPANGIALLERLRSLPQISDSLKLTSHYWLVRALQVTAPVRAKSEAESLMQQFPFTYYGLKLRAEANDGKLTWPGPAQLDQAVKGEWPLTPAQAEVIERVKILSASGWSTEVAEELERIPLAKVSGGKDLLAVAWTQFGAVHLSLPLIRQLGENDLNYRSSEFVGLSFPRPEKEIVKAESEKAKVSEILVWSLIRQESAFASRAVSSSGALGYMQLMPATAKEVAGNTEMGEFNIPEDVFQGKRNIMLGTRYLGQMLRKFQGSVPVALAAYNAGPTRIDTFLRSRPHLRSKILGVPQTALDEMWIDELPTFETSSYVKAILRNTWMYQLLDQSPVPAGFGFWTGFVN